MNTIKEIKNGVAKVEWRTGSEYALAEVDSRFQSVGDEVADHELVFNGGSPRYDELMNQFDGHRKGTQ